MSFKIALRRPAAVVLAVLLLPLLLGVAAAQTVATLPADLAPGAPLPFDPAVRRGTLSNGLAYYVKRNVEPRNRAQLWLAVRAGSILEEEDQRGLAHFVEHMAFNGTARFAKQEIIDYLESIGTGFGPDVNAYTSFDTTVYNLEIPTDDPEVTETAFQILSDWAYAVSFSPEEVEQERKVVMEEWRTGRGAGARIRDRQLPVLFGDSRYSERLPIGLPEVIRNAPPERLPAFYERWYRPDLMAVIAVGDFDAEVIEATVRRHFAPPPEGAAGQERARAEEPTERPRFGIPEHADTRVSVATDPEASITRVTLYHKLPASTDQDLEAYRGMVLNGLLSGMLNARLFERRQVADPPYVSAGAGRSRLVQDTDILVATAQVDQDGIERGLQTLLEELQRMQRHGFTGTELEREKATVLRGMESAYQERDQRPSRRLADEYLRHFVESEPVPGIEVEWELYQYLLPQISLAEVNALAATGLKSGNTVLLVSGPDSIGAEAAGAGPPAAEQLEADLRAQLAAMDSLQVEPYVDSTGDVPLLAAIPAPGSIVEERRLEEIDAVQWTLSNGITVIAKQTDFQNDQVLFRASSPGGNSLVADADYLPALTATALVAGSGAGVHDRVALDKLLAGKSVSVSPYLAELFEGFSGNASPQDLETLFQLIILYATAPRLDPTYYASYQSRLRSQVENRLARPDAAFVDTLRIVLSQNHYRARPLTLELLDELSLERSAAVYADRFADFGDFTFLFVGAFDWETLRSLSETYLASLPATARTEQWRDVGIDPPPGIEDHVVRRGIEPRSSTRLVFAGAMEWSREEALALSAMGEVLQIRLRERVREDLGGTYSIGVSTGAQLLPDAEYEVFVGFDSDPERADELLAAVLEEMEWVRAGGEQSYLDKVEELIRSSREEQLRRNGFWLNQIQTVVRRGESFAEINRFDERLEALTLEQVAAAARRYLTADRYVRVVLLPEQS